MSDYLLYLGYALAWRIIRILPENFVYSRAARLGTFLYGRDSEGVARMRSNYARMRPELSAPQLEALVEAGMQSYLRYWVDTFRSPSWSRARTIDTVVVDHEEFLRDPIASYRGCIVALPHAGNWDHAGSYFCQTGAPLTTVAEHLKPERLFQRFLAYREAIGMEVLDLNSRAIATLSQRLRVGKLVALVADRDLSKNGIDVDFAGYPARMPGGPALLAIQTGAPLITAFVGYEGRGIRITFGPEITVPTSGSTAEKASIMTQQVADWFAERIAMDTEDWHMLQRIWIDGDFVERSEVR
jgi:KDO2-lipid IV(A) lauroyltransferase